ncbi:MAG: hypothetical protein ACRDPY_29810, partial [Streptosporangiaceae bacterium]
MTGPRLAGDTGGGLGLSPKSVTWKVATSTTRDRYRPVGALDPGGPVASLAVKRPCIVSRNTRTPPEPGTKSPGVAEVSALAWVVSTAVTCDGAGSPSERATLAAIAVSLGTAEAGTGDPVGVGTGDPVGVGTGDPVGVGTGD